MNTGNRVLWAVIGVLLIGLGVVGVLINTDHMPRTDPQSSLLWPQLLDQWRRRQGWATVAVVVAGLIVALIGYWLLRIQLRPKGKRHMPDLFTGRHAPHRPGTGASTPPAQEPVAREPATPAGVTHVRYRAIADSLAADLRRQYAVRRASVLLTGHADTPELLLDLTARPGTDLASLRTGVHGALGRFAATTGLRPTSVLVNTRVDAGVPDHVA